ncbi:MAG TPA: CheR family methyltransferase [Planctomycetota bacterium]|nr:CheR family methyltransferase [Planctomycetota bacterium]
MIGRVRKAAPPKENRAEEVEFRLLLEGIFQFYGHDFRQYDPDLVRAQVLHRLREEDVESISQYQHRVLRDRGCLERLIEGLVSRRRSLFDPPGFWKLLRRKVIPVLRTYPYSRLWVAGCATGEDAYSLAIVIQEEGLASRAQVYATELDEKILARARQGRISAERIDGARRNYRAAGGKATLQAYGSSRKGGFTMNGSLAGRVVFASHSLATDSSFNEFNVILCRNLLSSFSPALQGRARTLLHQSLGLFGYLALGHRESMDETRFADCYARVDGRNHLHRRVR